LLLRAVVLRPGLCCTVIARMGTTKIFVGNIRDGTTSESLRELFECYGRVTEADVLSGFGFVVSQISLLGTDVSTQRTQFEPALKIYLGWDGSPKEIL